MATKELKQLWNNVDVVAIAVAIPEQRQRKFRARYLEYCNLQFPNLNDARFRLSFTLIFNYKRSTYAKKEADMSPKEKNHKETKEKQDSREKLRATQEENLQKSIGSSVLLILFLFSIYSWGCIL